MDLNAIRNAILQNVQNIGKGFVQGAQNVGNFVAQDIQRMPQVQQFNNIRTAVQSPQVQNFVQHTVSPVMNQVTTNLGQQRLSVPGVGAPQGPTLANIAHFVGYNPNSAIGQAAHGNFSQVIPAFQQSLQHANDIAKAMGTPTNQLTPQQVQLQKEGVGNLIMGQLGGGESHTFTQDQLNTVRNGFTQGVRDLLGQFAQKVETAKNPNKINLGPLGDYAHSVAASIFGENNVANLTNTQLKNALDAVQEAAFKKNPTQRFSVGLATQDIRDGAIGPVGNQESRIAGSNPIDQTGTAYPEQMPKGSLPQEQSMLQSADQAALNPNSLEPSLAQDTRKAMNGQQIKERGFVTSVKEGKNTPQAVKDLVNGSYVVKSDKQLKADARTLIKSDPQVAEQLALNPKNDTHVQVGNELINYYGSKGQFDKAQQIAEGMAKSGTEFGRAVHAFSQYDKTTPQGALRYAQQKINEYNKSNPNSQLKINDAQVKDIFDRAHAIQAMPEGRDRNIAANELMNTVNKLIPSSFTDKAITVWKAGLLTSLRTHERNLLSNTIHGAAEVAKDLPATLVDKALSLKTGQRTLTPTLQGIKSGAIEGTKAAKDIVTMGFDPNDAISKYDVKQINWGNNPVEQALKVYTNAVFRTLGGEDKPFWNASFARSLYDQAGAAAINAGKTGDKAFIENLVKNPTPEMLGNATKDANVATFHDTNKLTEIGKAVQNAKVGPVPVGQILAPFVGVPSSVAKQLVAYSPIGLLNGVKNAGKVLISSKEIPGLQRQAAQEIGRGVIGSGLIGIGSYLASKGLMTGQPSSPQEAKQWQLQGKQPNSVLVGGKWRSIGSIGPENLLVLAGAKANQELTGPNANPSQYAANLGKDFLGQTFLQGVQGPLNAVNDPTRYAKSYIGNQAASVVPNIVKDTAKAFDPTARQSNSIPDYFTNSIPLVRNGNLPQRDVLGNPIPQAPTGLGAYVDLFNSKTPVSNDVVNELGRLNDAGNNATPSKLTKSQTIKGVKTDLNPQQLDTLTATQGPQVTQSLSTLFKSPSYQALPDQEKANAVSSTVEQARKQVRGNIDLNNPTSAVTTQTPAVTNQSKIPVVNPDTGNVENIDLSKYAKTPVTAVAKAKLDAQRYTDAEKILKSSMPDSQKQQVYQQMGVSPSDVAYYDNASQSNTIKSIYVREQLSNFQGDHQALLQQLVGWRKDINGKQLVNSGVISDLVDGGYITKEEGTALNKVQYSQDLQGKYQVKMTGRGSGAKLKNIRLMPTGSPVKLKSYGTPKLRLKAPPKIGLPNVNFNTQFTPSVGVPTAPNFKAKVKFNV